ncbi:MAG: AbrB/MazE/SpoVT family DNA-binding domain-containing protein [Candidatus Ornithomonoglobus sp.]
MRATIQKWGNSQGIRIPKAFLLAVGMNENDTVQLERDGDTIIIKKCEQKKELTLDDIFAGYDGEYKAEQFDWGKTAGKEIW